MRFSFVKEVPGGNIYSIPQISVIPVFPGEEGKPGCCFRGSVNCFSWLCVVWGFDVIQHDSVGEGEDVTVLIVFRLHSIT